MKPMKLAIAGGGGGFFGEVHRRAGDLDPTRQVVAGVLSSDPERSVKFGEEWGLEHPFPTLDGLINAHQAGHVPLDYVVVATPNNQHAAVAVPLLEAGISVLCEKPLADTMENALAIARAAKKAEVPVRLAHTYLGYPMVQLAIRAVADGFIGDVRTATARYLQDWLAFPIEQGEQRQAVARTTPSISGPTCCGGDIGSHAYVVLEMVTGLGVESVSAMLSTIVEGRKLDDDFRAHCVLEDGQPATIIASQVAIGHMNDHGFEIVGSKGAVSWEQEDPEKLVWQNGNEQTVIRRAYGDCPFPGITELFRLPAGHGEGFHDALANCHRGMEDAVRQSRGEEPLYPGLVIPGLDEGLRTMAFLEACLKSNQENSALVKVQYPEL